MGVGEDCYRKVRGIAEGHKEDKAGWSAFLKHQKDRGLSGVRPIISDACMGLVESAAEFHPEAQSQIVEPGIFRLQLLQAPGLTDLHATILRFPAIETLLRNTMLAYQIGGLGTGLIRLDNADNLFFGVTLALHVETSLLSMLWEISNLSWLPWRGKGHLDSCLPNIFSLHRCWHFGLYVLLSNLDILLIRWNF
jgi:hypothetical protein